MLKPITVAAFVTVFFGLLVSQAPAPPPETFNFWINKHFMNIANEGGQLEAPGNTLFALKTAKARGADVVAIEGYLTADGEFVITHDLEPHKTSDAPYSRFENGSDHIDPEQFVTNQSLEELRQFDFAYKFRAGTGTDGYPHQNPEEEGSPSDYIYRGIATGEKAAPAGFADADFQIATLEQVLTALPNMPLSLDIKAPPGDPANAIAAAIEVARIMNEHRDRSLNVIVTSTFQAALDKFHELMPYHLALGSTGASLSEYLAGTPIVPEPAVIQTPDRIDIGSVGSPSLVEAVPTLKPKANLDGYAIQARPAAGTIDGVPTWQRVIGQGADGFFTDRPTELDRYLCDIKVALPNGFPRCAAQRCPNGTAGIAPDCKSPPPAICQGGQIGTFPDCRFPEGTITSLTLSPGKSKILAGKNMKLKLRTYGTAGPGKFLVTLRSSNRRVRVPRQVTVNQRGNSPITLVRVRAGRKAKGKAAITASRGGLSSRSVLVVRNAKKLPAGRG